MKKFLLICTALCFNALADNNPCQNPNSFECRDAAFGVCRRDPNSSACTSALSAVCQNPYSGLCRVAVNIACRKNTNSVFCASAVSAACQNPNSPACVSAKEIITAKENCKKQEGYWFNSSCKKLNQGKTFNLPAGHTLGRDVYNLQPFQSGNFVTANTKSSALNYIDNGYYPTCVNCSVSGSQLTCECLDRGFDSYVKSSIKLKDGNTCISNNNGTMTYC